MFLYRIFRIIGVIELTQKMTVHESSTLTEEILKRVRWSLGGSLAGSGEGSWGILALGFLLPFPSV